MESIQTASQYFQNQYKATTHDSTRSWVALTCAGLCEFIAMYYYYYYYDYYYYFFYCFYYFFRMIISDTAALESSDRPRTPSCRSRRPRQPR